MSARNAEVVRRLIGEVIGGGRLELVEELLTPDYHDHDPANDEDVRGPEGAREEVAMYRAAFPDLTFAIHDQLADADRVATRFTFTGTHRGRLMGVPPTGRTVSVDGIVIHRLEGGRIAEGHWCWDTLGLLRTVGALPADEPATAGAP